MPGLLVHELRMSVPFASREMEAVLNLMRTADYLRREVAELLSPHGLSPSSYNVLRILRGAGTAGLPCSEVSQRLVTHDPDITRLADRLMASGWVVRDRQPGDRRVVVLRITPEGSDLVVRLDVDLQDLHRRQLSHLGQTNLDMFIRLLEQARQSEPVSTPENP